MGKAYFDTALGDKARVDGFKLFGELVKDGEMTVSDLQALEKAIDTNPSDSPNTYSIEDIELYKMIEAARTMGQLGVHFGDDAIEYFDTHFTGIRSQIGASRREGLQIAAAGIGLWASSMIFNKASFASSPDKLLIQFAPTLLSKTVAAAGTLVTAYGATEFVLGYEPAGF